MQKTIFMTSFGAVWYCFFCFAMGSCTHSEQPQLAPSPAFYHWKTQLKLDKAKRSYLDSIGVKKLYVKFFDVDWDGATTQPVPLATVELDTINLNGLEIVPTIFITNRTLLNLPMQQLDTLASLIFQKIKSLQTQTPLEIQFDCDWTAKTQAKYFALLTSFRQIASFDSSFIIHHSSLILSATIRLHQSKYFEKTGVPPVDRGMLMCYNMGDLENWEIENSILDLEVAKTYLPPIVNRQSSIIDPYPIPLDFALPLFRWGVLFRDGRMIKLLNGLSVEDLQDTSRFQKMAENRYEVRKSTYLQMHYLYVGDRLRLDGVSPEALLSMTKLLGERINDSPTTLAFYHIDSTATQLFPKEKIIATLRQF